MQSVNILQMQQKSGIFKKDAIKRSKTKANTGAQRCFSVEIEKKPLIFLKTLGFSFS